MLVLDSTARLLPSRLAFFQQRSKSDNEHGNDLRVKEEPLKIPLYIHNKNMLFRLMEALFDHEKLGVYCVELQFTSWIADFCAMSFNLRPHTDAS